MAGSYRHMTTPGGKLRSNESFVGMIENLGDAYEAAKECYGMIWWLADRLAAEYDGSASTGGDTRFWIENAEKHYKDGLKLGGVQRPR